MPLCYQKVHCPWGESSEVQNRGIGRLTKLTTVHKKYKGSLPCL